jgi:PIN domain nuclease of toxin-antitoxin system
MRLLLDTHLLLWAAGMPERLPERARLMMEDPSNVLHYSAASVWEIVIKNGLGRADFSVDVRALRRGLEENGYIELPVTSSHAITVSDLPALHKDPFDRLLLAQAMRDDLLLVTADETLARYAGPILKV